MTYKTLRAFGICLLVGAALLFAAQTIYDFTLDPGGEFRVRFGEAEDSEFSVQDDVVYVRANLQVIPDEGAGQTNHFQVTDGATCVNPDGAGTCEVEIGVSYTTMHGVRYYPPSAAAPYTCDGGDPLGFYIDTTANEFCYCNATAWVAVDGSGTCA